MNVPPVFKNLSQYVKRAEELDRDSNIDSKIVAYFCRSFAVERGIKLKAEGPEVNAFLMGLMNIMDRDKGCIAGVSAEERKLVCERFAYTVFGKADDEDRAGVADKNTAKTFYAAATFLDILEQFGELDSDVVEKRRYAKFKAADIINSIKAGVKPAIGGPDEAPEAPVAAVAAPADDLSAWSIPSAPTQIPITPLPLAPFAAAPAPAFQYQPPVQPYQPQAYSPAPAPVAPSAPPLVRAVPAAAAPLSPAPAPSPARYVSSPTSMNDPRAKDAMELCAFAMAALKHNEIALARERLALALQKLG